MANFNGTKGEKIIYLYRLFSERTTTTGQKVAYVSDNTSNMSTNAETLATKDGTFTAGGNVEVTIDTTAYLKSDDEMHTKLKTAMRDQSDLEIWEVDLNKPATGTGNEGKYQGTYYRGKVTAYNVSSTAGEWATVDMSFGINGTGVDGPVTVPQGIIDETDYVFADATVATQ